MQYGTCWALLTWTYIGLIWPLTGAQRTEHDISTQVNVTNSSIRLVDGSSPHEGRVEVYWNGRWITICDDSWGIAEADVVCRQLGYSSALQAVGNAKFGEGSGYVLLKVQCVGHETDLFKCPSLHYYQNDCSHANDVGVICEHADSAIYYREGSIRLAGSSSENAGRVEIFHMGSWGTVCDDSWDIDDADVVCKQLGYPDGARLVHTREPETFGLGRGDILLDQVSCDGSEHYLTDCQHNGWYEHNCAHIEDAGVTCFLPQRYQPRLVNGSTWYEGRVEIWNIGHWEGVCSRTFGENEARVVCKELGFSGLHAIEDYEKFGNSFSAPASVQFTCTESNVHLSSCTTSHLSDSLCEATAISCVPDTFLSRSALAGISFIAFITVLIFVAILFHIYHHLTRKSTTSPPAIITISGQDSVRRNQSAPHTSCDWQEPPSYNDVISDPFYYPTIRTKSCPNMNQQPHKYGSRTL